VGKIKTKDIAELGYSNRKFWDRVLPENPKKFLTEVNECNNCSSFKIKFLENLEPAQLFVCQCCQHVFLSPRLSDETLSMLYADNEGQLSIERGGQLKAYMESRFATMKAEMFYPEKIKVESLLDIGCGWGHFLSVAQHEFQKVEGVELSTKQSQWARERLNLKVSSQDIYEFKSDRTYSVISIWEVIEHLTQPEKMIRWCHEHLESGGQLVLSTPNYNSLYRKILGNRWFYYIPSQHISYYNVKSLTHLLKSCGFSQIRCCTSGRSLWKERTNRHNQINLNLSLREQWLQSLSLRSVIEDERDEVPSAKSTLQRGLERLLWRFLPTLYKRGYGDQLRVYAMK